MLIEVSENGYMTLRHVFNPVFLRTEDGEEISICMRDSGFEVVYEGKSFELKKGEFIPNPEHWNFTNVKIK